MLNDDEIAVAGLAARIEHRSGICCVNLRILCGTDIHAAVIALTAEQIGDFSAVHRPEVFAVAVHDGIRAVRLRLECADCDLLISGIDRLNRLKLAARGFGAVRVGNQYLTLLFALDAAPCKLLLPLRQLIGLCPDGFIILKTQYKRFFRDNHRQFACDSRDFDALRLRHNIRQIRIQPAQFLNRC